MVIYFQLKLIARSCIDIWTIEVPELDCKRRKFPKPGHKSHRLLLICIWTSFQNILKRFYTCRLAVVFPYNWYAILVFSLFSLSFLSVFNFLALVLAIRTSVCETYIYLVASVDDPLFFIGSQISGDCKSVFDQIWTSKT